MKLEFLDIALAMFIMLVIAFIYEGDPDIYDVLQEFIIRELK